MAACSAVNSEVERYVTETAKRELAPTRVVNVNMQEDVSGVDGGPLYRISIIYEGDRPQAKKLGKMMRAITHHFWEIEDEHSALFRFFRPESEALSYALQ